MNRLRTITQNAQGTTGGLLKRVAHGAGAMVMIIGYGFAAASDRIDAVAPKFKARGREVRSRIRSGFKRQWVFYTKYWLRRP